MKNIRWTEQEKYKDIISSDWFRDASLEILYGKIAKQRRCAWKLFGAVWFVPGLYLLFLAAKGPNNDINVNIAFGISLCLLVLGGVFIMIPGMMSPDDVMRSLSEEAIRRDVAAAEPELHKLAESMYLKKHPENIPPAGSGADILVEAVAGKKHYAKLQIESAAERAADRRNYGNS